MKRGQSLGFRFYDVNNEIPISMISWSWKELHSIQFADSDSDPFVALYFFQL